MDEVDPRFEFREIWAFEKIAPSRLDKIGLELPESGGLFHLHVVFPLKVP
jgi:hypothetical protein